jgi:hypothetical protein
MGLFVYEAVFYDCVHMISLDNVSQVHYQLTSFNKSLLMNHFKIKCLEKTENENKEIYLYSDMKCVCSTIKCHHSVCTFYDNMINGDFVSV